MQKTTIAGAFTAFIGLLAALINVLWGMLIPAEVVATLTSIGLAVIAIFADPNQIRSVAAIVALIIEKAIWFANLILGKFYPDITWAPILAFLQPVAILIFSYVIQDANKNVIQPRAPTR
jgi:hypothetical protein